MTAFLMFTALAAGAVGGSLGTHRIHQRQQDIAGYDAHWTTQDLEATKHELAVTVIDRGRWHRHAKSLERVARNQAGLLTSRRRRPIPLPAPHTYPLDYGTGSQQ